MAVSRDGTWEHGDEITCIRDGKAAMSFVHPFKVADSHWTDDKYNISVDKE